LRVDTVEGNTTAGEGNGVARVVGGHFMEGVVRGWL
jgi:hypothetical protein